MDAGVRASDRDRGKVVRQLRDEIRDGRLTENTFTHRVDLAVRARDQADLEILVADLPRRGRLARWLAAGAGHLGAFARAIVPRGLLPRRTGELTLPPAPGRYVIGRDPQADLYLTHASVSHHHAEMSYVDGAWLLTDLGSRNGTRVNGWRLAGPATVGHGDIVDLGAWRVHIVDRTARR